MDENSAARLRFDVLTLFPAMLESPLRESILRRAIERRLIDVRAHDLRDWSSGPYRQVDDAPYGGGAGMVIKPEPVFAAVEQLAVEPPAPDAVILFTPLGRRFTQAVARELSSARRLILLCGRYEGFDERVHRRLATDEISVGDYVLSGGELPALVLIDAVTRLIPGALGDEASAESDSFSEELLEYPHYTRPPVFRGYPAPPELLTGDHAAIQEWRRKQSLERTLRLRPDLFRRHRLTPQDLRLLGLTLPPRRRRRNG